MKPSAALAAAAPLALSIALWGAEPAAAAKYKLRQCGSIEVRGETGATRQAVSAGGVSCSFARRTALESARAGTGPPGWACIGSGAETFCAQGSAEAVGRLESDKRRRPFRKYVRAKG